MPWLNSGTPVQLPDDAVRLRAGLKHMLGIGELQAPI